MSVGVFVAVAKSNANDINQGVVQQKLIVNPEVKSIIDGKHKFLRHAFYMHDKKLGIKLFHENDSDEFRDGLWSTIRDDLGSNTENIISKVTDEQLKTDLTRAVYLWKYAGDNKDEKALIYAYMIFVDLDAMINNYTSGSYGVTELSGNKGQKYSEMIDYYDNYVKN